VRYLGHFLTEDPLDVPWSAVEYVGGQLDIADPSVVKRYTERQQTAYEHSWEIRSAYGYRDFTDPGVREALAEFMSARAWIHAGGLATGAPTLLAPVPGGLRHPQPPGDLRHRHALGEPARRLRPYRLSSGPPLRGQAATVGVAHPCGVAIASNDVTPPRRTHHPST
jgi:hypothetical protein